MAGEIFAAFRTILLFISVSWLSVMYLLVYRIPRLERINLREGGINQPFFQYPAKIQTFDDKSTNGDLGNQRRKLQFSVYYDQNHNVEELDTAEITDDASKDGLIGRPQVFPKKFDCRDLEKVKFGGLLGSGYTKTVRKGFLNGREFAVKYTTERNHDIIKCTKERAKSRHFECFNLAKFKLLKEAMLFQQLRHPNIVEIYGLCPWRWNDVEGSESIMTVITEIGKPLDMIKFIQIPWDDRLKMIIDLIGLLSFFETSPLGSLHIRDFRIDQFIIVNGKIKLTDLDDVDGKRKQCSSSADCFVGGRTGNTTLPCENEFCSRYAAVSNMYSLDKTFLDYSLNYDNPEVLTNDLKRISQKVKSFSYGFKELHGEIIRVVENIKNGSYSKIFIQEAKKKTDITKYEMFPDATVLTASSDYYCRQSRTFNSCEIAVNNIEEAKVVCSMDKNCRAFVVTPRRNWLGQKIVVLKNNGKSLTPVTNFTAFVRDG